MKYKKTCLLLVLVCLQLLACDVDDTIVSGNYTRGDLIESVEKGTLTKDEIVDRVTELSASAFAQYGVSYEVITYRTEYMGKPIDSRGLLILPQNADKIHLLMYCHGTELPSVRLNVEKITPSLYDGGRVDFRDVRNMGLGWATADMRYLFRITSVLDLLWVKTIRMYIILKCLFPISMGSWL
ncbi:hypothetical protein [Dyadobacter sp. LHD-138]|uniref:hypothetical protein n=1 Tax=Dyadobacter sp. LHD-138 TaxID=3071413 RepID=UPI0027E0960D|nr:hypothetical protein [Dyadobacter sp. LHD-138]MDQ6477553.1 hypothetical protein [Dyadobacter sp. LHD-138]